MVLKPQDVLVALKLVSWREQPWTYAQLAVALDISPSQAHAAVKRALAAQLAVQRPHGIGAHLHNLEEFLLHGIRYVFIAERGEPTRGVATAHAAPPLRGRVQQGNEPPPVWPHPEGGTRGVALSPLFRSAPAAALADPFLHELLALVDCLRAGRARDRELAAAELTDRMEATRVPQ